MQYYYAGSNPRWSTVVKMTEYPNPHPGVPGSSGIDHRNSAGSENKLPCGAQMSKELSSFAPLSVNRPPACNHLQVCIQPPAEVSKPRAVEPVPIFASISLHLTQAEIG